MEMLVLFEINRSFRYYFAYFVYYSLFSLTSVIFIPYMMLRPLDVRNALLPAMFGRSVSWMIGLRWEIRGKELLEKDRACIVLSNHQSSLDLLGMMHLWPIIKKCSLVARKEVFYVWPFGLAAWLSGTTFIDRKNFKKTKFVLDNCIQQVKDKKIKLWIFPEGTRRNTGEVHEFKKGAFHLAVNSQLPILPVVFSSYYFLSKEEKRFTSGRIIITALPTISTEGMSAKDIPELMEKTKEVMKQAYDSTNKEIQLFLQK